MLAALLGVGVHFLRALPGLVADNEDGWRTCRCGSALKTGATRLLVISLAWTALCLAGLLVVGSLVGLSQCSAARARTSPGPPIAVRLATARLCANRAPHTAYRRRRQTARRRPAKA